MRRLVFIVVCAALLWSAWWAAGTFLLRQGVEGWFADRRAEGWQADVQEIEPGGYPGHMTATLRDLALADPDTAVSVTADTLVIRARALWPGDVTVLWPETPITVSTPQGQSRLTMTDSVMALELRPGVAGQVETVGWTAADWGVTTAFGSVASAEAFHLTMDQMDDPAAYRLSFDAPGLRPGEAPRAALRIPDDWPLTFDRFEARMDVTFDRPWDKRALDDRRPQPRVIDLSLAEAAWGDLRLNLAADLTVDDGGVPSGTVALQAENWRRILDFAQNAGLLPPAFRGQAEQALSVLAGLNGGPDTIDVTLTLRDGRVAVGFIHLFPAPRLVLR